MIWLAIILMSAIVFTSRYLFLEPKVPLKLNPAMQRFLSYASPAVLTAIWGPIVFAPEKTLALQLSNPYLIGALAAGIMSWYSARVLLSVSLSMAVFLIYKLTLEHFS